MQQNHITYSTLNKNYEFTFELTTYHAVVCKTIKPKKNEQHMWRKQQHYSNHCWITKCNTLLTNNTSSLQKYNNPWLDFVLFSQTFTYKLIYVACVMETSKLYNIFRLQSPYERKNKTYANTMIPWPFPPHHLIPRQL